ncbi:hypothetical protein ABZX98_15500 [Streptomyces sp. NPDC002992]|uniref:hypothetical protein n=1 Tax=Streptomyces sp. NPDC002992 TaxID=3154273 RepID=UPI0033A8D125
MMEPTVNPSLLYAKLWPHGAGTVLASLSDVPAGDVTAHVDGGDGAIRVQRVRVSELFTRPCTEEEIRELPPFPPSIRENARRHGLVDEREIADGDGSGPLTVPAKGILSITLGLAAADGASPSVADGRLIVESTSWGPVEAPVFCLVGDSHLVPSVEPDSVKCSIEPGETRGSQIAITEAPSSTSVLAYVTGGEQIIRLKNVITFRPVHRHFTEAEILELPPYPPSIREDARRNGYIEYQETGRRDGPGTLQVAARSVISFYLEFAAPLPHHHDSKSATLVIDAPDWQRVEVPLHVIMGKIEASVTPAALAVRQAATGQISTTLRSVAGPGTVVRTALGMGNDTWRVEPDTVHLAPGETVTVALTVLVDDEAPVGTYPVGFETYAFDELQMRSHPFDLTVRPAPVTVKSLTGTVVVPQGGKAACPVLARSEGGYKRLTVTGAGLPPGVRVLPVSRELGYGADSEVVPVDFVADALGPTPTGYLTSLDWDAADGEHKGRIWVRTTVTRPVESRTFHQQITTPSGTALGGWAELVIRSDGTYTFRGHMHDSGFDPYAFRIGVVVRSPDGTKAVAALKSGTVAGTLGSGSRDFDWNESGINPGLESDWDSMRNASAAFTKWYEDTGMLGALEDMAEVVGEFLVVNVVAGPLVATVLVLGSELGSVTELPYAHPTGVAGVLIAGGVLLVLGPTGLIPAVVAGATLAEQIVRTRPLRDSEITFASTVFGDTLPVGRILVTDLSRAGDRAFCTRNVDGSILLGLGTRFDAPLANTSTKRTLVHELTHAWQIAHRPAEDIASLWEAVTNEVTSDEDVYASSFTFDGRAWSEWGIEPQAQIVALWWSIADILGGVNTPDAVASVMFPYVQNNIRMGRP